MVGRMNIAAGGIFSSESSSMSRARTDYSGGGEADFRALSKKDAQTSMSITKDELEYEYSDDFEQQMRDWRNDDYK